MLLEEFEGCKIYKYEAYKTLYEVVHSVSNEILFAVSLSQAYKIARLLNLDYVLSSIYCKEEKNNEKY